MQELPAHASPAFPPLYSPQAHHERTLEDFVLAPSDVQQEKEHGREHEDTHGQGHQYPPPSLISPAFTPPTTPGTQTPSHPRPPRSIPVDTSTLSRETSANLVEQLPVVECEVRARIPTTTGHEMWLHVYRNNVDSKEHLAIVFGSEIRSRSLDKERPGETELDRMTRGAYVGRLYPGRTSSRVEQIKSAAGVGTARTSSATAAAAAAAAVVTAPAAATKSARLPATAEATSLPSPVSASPASTPPPPPSSLPPSDTALPLVRIHSECYTGETVWSARCDCGEQLDEAARLMSSPLLSPTGGAIIYLRQEGRGIGLGEKLKAYNLQDLGNDTYEANLLLRHPADARSYGLATSMLVDLGLGGERGIRLLTNNPDKVRAVEGPGREVVCRERVAMVPLAWKTGGREGIRSEEVEKYLSTKIEKFKHMLSQK